MPATSSSCEELLSASFLTPHWPEAKVHAERTVQPTHCSMRAAEEGSQIFCLQWAPRNRNAQGSPLASFPRFFLYPQYGESSTYKEHHGNPIDWVKEKARFRLRRRILVSAATALCSSQHQRPGQRRRLLAAAAAPAQAHQAKDVVTGKAHDASEAASDAAHAAKDKAVGAKDTVAGKAAEARDSVGEGVAHAGDAIKDKARCVERTQFSSAAAAPDVEPAAVTVLLSVAHAHVSAVVVSVAGRPGEGRGRGHGPRGAARALRRRPRHRREGTRLFLGACRYEPNSRRHCSSAAAALLLPLIFRVFSYPLLRNSSATRRTSWSGKPTRRRRLSATP